MSENLMIPFTIVKRNDEAAANSENQYKWERKGFEERAEFDIKNITLAQEPAETLDIRVIMFRYKSDERNGVLYRFFINFSNYLHQFSDSYSYEIVCKMQRPNQPDACVFYCVERRINKLMNVLNNFVSITTLDADTILSNPDLYFCIRRVNFANVSLNTPLVSSISSTFQKLNCNDCQVILKADNGHIIKVHKFLLSQYSDVFQAMLIHPMRESQEGVIQIPNFEPRVIQKMVDYLYTGRFEDTSDVILELLKLAHQYQMNDLCRRCEEYYFFNINLDNGLILDALRISSLCDLKDLNRKAYDFIKSNEKYFIQVPACKIQPS